MKEGSTHRFFFLLLTSKHPTVSRCVYNFKKKIHESLNYGFQYGLKILMFKKLAAF